MILPKQITNLTVLSILNNEFETLLMFNQKYGVFVSSNLIPLNFIMCLNIN